MYDITATRLIESMMVSMPRQGISDKVSRLFNLMRGFVEHDTNDLKTNYVS